MTEAPQLDTWADLTAFQRDTLAAIARLERDGTDPHGLGIMAELERDRPALSNGSLYPVLDVLARADLLTVERADGRTNHYRLTDAGRELLRRQAQRLVCVTADGQELAERELVADGGES